MPLIKSAIKKAKQDVVKTDRNRHYKTKMQTMYKNIQKFVTA
jgi:ribosomal protein S20